MPDSVGVALWDTLPSTQDAAMSVAEKLIDRGAPVSPLLIAAHRQTGGRGQDTRTWYSPQGGYYGSVLLPVQPENLSALPLKVGLTLTRFLQSLHPLDLSLRWPNDLLLAGKKVAGILINVRGEIAVVGLGVNLFIAQSDLNSEKLQDAANLSDRASLFADFSFFHSAVIHTLIPRLQTAMAQTFPREEWESMSAFRPGARLSWLSQGVRQEGIYRGISEQGYLCVTREGVDLQIVSASLVREESS